MVTEKLCILLEQWWLYGGFIEIQSFLMLYFVKNDDKIILKEKWGRGFMVNVPVGPWWSFTADHVLKPLAFLCLKDQ